MRFFKEVTRILIGAKKFPIAVLAVYYQRYLAQNYSSWWKKIVEFQLQVFNLKPTWNRVFIKVTG